MKNKFKLFSTLIACMVLFGFTAACNTMEGIGQDTQKAGEWIEKKANQ